MADECWGDKASFNLAKSHLGLDVDEKVIDLPDLNADTVGHFDVVLFLGVFYHLKHLLLELERIAPLCKESLILETQIDALDCDRPAMIFYPGDELSSDPTNWWGPNPACVTAILKGLGFSAVEFTPRPPKKWTRGIFHAYRTPPSREIVTFDKVSPPGRSKGLQKSVFRPIRKLFN